MALSIKSFISHLLGLVGLEDAQPLHLDLGAKLLVLHLGSKATLSFLASSTATSRRRTIGRVRSGESPEPCTAWIGLLVDRDGLVGIGLVQAAGLGDLGADLGVELLGGQGLGILGGRRAADLPVLLGLLVGAASAKGLDLGPQAFVERVAGRGHFGQEGTRPAIVAGREAPPGLLRRGSGHRLARRALIWAISSSAWASTPNLPVLGLVGKLLGGRVIAVLVQGLGLAEQLTSPRLPAGWPLRQA